MNMTSLIFLHLAPLGCLIFLMVLSMPETFIEPVKATFMGLRMLLK